MSKKAEYYTCEQDNIDHDFKTVDLILNRVKYPNVLVCRRCASIFNIGGYKVSMDQLRGMDLGQFKMKELTATAQAIMFAKKKSEASIPKARHKKNLRELLDTLLTEKDETAAIPPRSIWRMNSK